MNYKCCLNFYVNYFVCNKFYEYGDGAKDWGCMLLDLVVLLLMKFRQRNMQINCIRIYV